MDIAVAEDAILSLCCPLLALSDCDDAIVVPPKYSLVQHFPRFPNLYPLLAAQRMPTVLNNQFSLLVHTAASVILSSESLTDGMKGVRHSKS